MSPLVQLLLVGLIVAAAALWTLWSMILPRGMKRAVLARFGRKPKAGCERCGGD